MNSFCFDKVLCVLIKNVIFGFHGDSSRRFFILSCVFLLFREYRKCSRRSLMVAGSFHSLENSETNYQPFLWQGTACAIMVGPYIFPASHELLPTQIRHQKPLQIHPPRRRMLLRRRCLPGANKGITPQR